MELNSQPILMEQEGIKSAFSVALVCMPFASADRPSIQLGLLGAIAERAGFSVALHHLNLDLAAQLTPAIYEPMCERRSHMTGEWLFAKAAFGDEAPMDEESYHQAFPGELTWLANLGKEKTYITELRKTILPTFIDNCLESIDWGKYSVIGFSSLFQQNVASLALAKRIKLRFPSCIIVFGGANMEGEMGQEYARAFDYIDYVVSGEADEVFPKLLQSLSEGDKVSSCVGVFQRDAEGASVGSQASPVVNMDAQPIPNYAPYFEHAHKVGLANHYKATWSLPYESSRGCWWGQKRHCTFCGLNGLGMGYRSKSPQRMLAELAELSHRHNFCSFMAVDNILDLKYLKDFFPRITAEKLDYCFFYEIKANLTYEQIGIMYRGGIRRVQPGIESLSSHVLKLMRKGVTMLQNVRCMKWFSYYGIGVNWNLLHGFPGETAEDYEKELEVLKSITHLEPPVGSGRIWLERFSPHFTDSTFPVSNTVPEASYAFVYPKQVDLKKAAFFFDYHMGETLDPMAHLPTHKHLEEWRGCWRDGRRHTLTYRRTGSSILIDVNRGKDQWTSTVTGVNALIYELCVPTSRTPGQIAEQLASLSEDYRYPTDEIREALDEFCKAKLMLSEDDQYLSLAHPSNPNW